VFDTITARAWFFNWEGALKRLVLFLLVLMFLLPGAGCKLPHVSWKEDEAAGEPDQYVVTNAEITLAWDPSPSEVVSYRLYYRNHGAEEWIFVAEVSSSDAPECTIAHASFGNGDFDFGVMAINDGAAESAIHTSLDTTACPLNGWYLHWEVEHL
jgi:hypothetical protein